MRRSFLAFVALCLFTAPVSAAVIAGNPTSNNGGTPGWAIFFDLNALGGQALSVTELTTASTATAGSAFTVEVFTRAGTALGGPVNSGPGSSSAGWTSLGTAPATQGATTNGNSLPIDIPDISVPSSGATVGVAVLFTLAGPRYFGTGSGPYQTFSDPQLSVTTGDARSAPFSAGGSWFAPRGLTGTVTYAVPEPSTIGLTIIGALGFLARRNRR